MAGTRLMYKCVLVVQREKAGKSVPTEVYPGAAGY